MKVPGKAIATIAILVALTAGALIAQRSASSPRAVVLTKQDMEMLVNEVLPPAQQQQIASDPEQKKKLAQGLKELLSIAQLAEDEGYAERPESKSRIALQTDLTLRDVYEKKNPGAQVSDEEVNSYYQAHPNEFNDFLQANPQFQAQAQGPQAEGIKKEFGQIKVIAERARKEGLENDQTTKLRLLLERSQVLARAYVGELQKNADKLVSDAEVDQYYKEHPEEFEEVRARHILISTEPPAPEPGQEDKKGAAKKKPLTKEEARQKAQSILDRIRKGEDFAKLAQENSDDPGSKDKGGDLDYFKRGMMVPPFEQAAFTLKPGEVSDLVESDFGFHIIKVEDRRASPPSDAKVRQQVTEKLKQKKLEDRIKEIAQNSSVQVAEDFNVTPKAPEPQISLPSGVPAPPTQPSER